MSEFLTNGAEAVAILSFVFGAFYSIVLKPLNASIADLRACIDAMRTDMARERARREALYRRVMLCEEHVRAAQKRLDSIGAKPEYVLGGGDA